jgi:hypothetical protein
VKAPPSRVAALTRYATSAVVVTLEGMVRVMVHELVGAMPVTVVAVVVVVPIRHDHDVPINFTATPAT